MISCIVNEWFHRCGCQQSKRTKLDVIPRNVEPVEIADLAADSRKTSSLLRNQKQMVPCSQITDINKLVNCIGRIEVVSLVVYFVCFFYCNYKLLFF